MSGVPACGCRSGRLAWLAAAVASLLVVSCGQDAASAEEEPEIVDHTDVITDADFQLQYSGELDYLTEEPDPRVDDLLLAEPAEEWDLRLVWPGGSCHTAPTAEFDGQAGTMTAITLDVGPWNEPEDDMVTCDAALRRHVVDVQTTADVADDVDLTLVDGESPK